MTHDGGCDCDTVDRHRDRRTGDTYVGRPEGMRREGPPLISREELELTAEQLLLEQRQREALELASSDEMDWTAGHPEAKP